MDGILFLSTYFDYQCRQHDSFGAGFSNRYTLFASSESPVPKKDLPTNLRPCLEMIPQPAAPVAVPKRLRVLIVDDEPDCADSLGALLELSGYEVAIAYGGEEAVTQADSFQPHTIICDLNMPGTDGFTVARTLRGKLPFTGVRLIALTAYSDAENRRRSQEAGFDHHLVKPANPPALMDLLAEG